MATATLLPNPRFVVVDANGAPVSGAMVHTYIPGGTVSKTSWQDAAETIPNSNPIICDAAGSCLIYGSGSYQLTVTDSLGVAVPGYSGVTADTLSPVTTETARALAAEAALAAGFTAATTNPGFFKLPSGLTVQFGSTVVTVAGSAATLPFGFAFPTALRAVLVVNGDSAAAAGEVNVVLRSTASVTLQMTGFAAGAFRVDWLAVGV